eukprot:4765239-Alexandrium_andersonii.AAC.1
MRPLVPEGPSGRPKSPEVASVACRSARLRALAAAPSRPANGVGGEACDDARLREAPRERASLDDRRELHSTTAAIAVLAAPSLE